jgi:hypothetical protein
MKTHLPYWLDFIFSLAAGFFLLWVNMVNLALRDAYTNPKLSEGQIDGLWLAATIMGAAPVLICSFGVVVGLTLLLN